MSAQPVDHSIAVFDPEDILNRLPERHRDHFLADYHSATANAAHGTWRAQEVHDLLRLWHLRAVSYADPMYEQALRETELRINLVPAEDVIPGWADMVAAHEARHSG